MPFTFSHTAAAMLFKPWLQKKKLSFTGLVLGCMSPDFEYFFRMQMKGTFGHHLKGIFFFDLPVAILLAFLIHVVIRDQLIEYLPKPLKQRFIIYQHKNWVEYFKQHVSVVVLSIFIGIFTHIVWDAFTHKTGFFVEKITMLQQVVGYGGFNIYLYKLMQHLSSTLGLAIILIYIYKMPSYNVPLGQTYRCDYILYWLMVFMCLIVFWWLWCLIHPSLMYSIGHIVVSLIACSFWSVFFTSLFFKLFRS